MADFEIVAIPSCNVTYEVLNELQAELMMAFNELHTVGRHVTVKEMLAARRLIRDVEHVERVRLLVKEIIDPKEDSDDDQ